MFAKANEENVSPVKMAQKMPKLDGSDLERELARYFDNGSTSGSSPIDGEKIEHASGSSIEDAKEEK